MTYKGAFPVNDYDKVTNSTTHFYKVATYNQSGSRLNSIEVRATPVGAGKQADDWILTDIGTCSLPDEAGYAKVSKQTFVVSGTGDDIGGKSDGLAFVYNKVTGDLLFTTPRATSAFSIGKHLRSAY